MPPAPSPIVRRRRLGAELRRLREAARLTGDQVIERVGWASASKLSRLENGRSRPDLSDVLDLLDVYGVIGSTREDLISIARDARNTRGWLRSYPVMTERQRAYAELEAGCADIREYGATIVPGLLQAPEYARVRILSAQPLAARPSKSRPGDDAETEVAARLARQGLLTRGTDPPRYEAVVHEDTLTGGCGPPAVMRAQLRHLHQLATLPNVTVRVLSRSAIVAEWYLAETAFSIYRFADPDDPSAVAIETLTADMILTDEPALNRYDQIFEWLRGAARPPDESLTWIAQAADAYPASPSALSSPPVSGDGTAGRPAVPPAQRQGRDQPHAEPST